MWTESSAAARSLDAYDVVPAISLAGIGPAAARRARPGDDLLILLALADRRVALSAMAVKATGVRRGEVDLRLRSGLPSDGAPERLAGADGSGNGP